MTEVTGLDPVFMQGVYNLTAYKAVPNGRKVQKNKDGKRPSVFVAELYRFIKTQAQTNDLAVNDLYIIGISNRVLLTLQTIRASRTPHNPPKGRRCYTGAEWW